MRCRRSSISGPIRGPARRPPEGALLAVWVSLCARQVGMTALREVWREEIRCQVHQGVPDLAVLEEPEVQVRSRVPDSRATHGAYTLAGVHLLADLHVVAREMCVEGNHAVSVVDFHE